MANLKTSQLPEASALTGVELVEAVQGGDNVKTTSQAIANLTTKASLGLGNVDNTSDANKPVSTAQQTAIDQGVSEANSYTNDAITGVANGVLDDAKAYADQQDANLSSFLEGQISSGDQSTYDNSVFYTDGAVSTINTAIDNKISREGDYDNIYLSANGLGVITPQWQIDNSGDNSDGTLSIASAFLTISALSELIISSPVLRLIGGVELRTFTAALTFNNDHDLLTVTGGARSFTVNGGLSSVVHFNGIGIVARLNTPASVSFSADFLLVPGSDAIDLTKMNVVTFRFFKDYDGAGNNKVLYTIKNLPAV